MTPNLSTDVLPVINDSLEVDEATERGILVVGGRVSVSVLLLLYAWTKNEEDSRDHSIPKHLCWSGCLGIVPAERVIGGIVTLNPSTDVLPPISCSRPLADSFSISARASSRP